MSTTEEKEVDIVSDPENNPEPFHSSPDVEKVDDYETIYMVTHHVVHHHHLEIPASHTPPSLFQRMLRRIGSIYHKLTGKVQVAEDAVQDTLHTATDKISNAIGDAKDTIDSTAEKVASASKEKIKHAKDSVADTIHSAEDTIHSQYEHAKDGISDAAHSTGEQIENIKEKAHRGVEKTKNALHNTEKKVEHVGGRVKEAVFSPWNYAKEYIFKTAKEKVGKTAASVEESIADRLNESRDDADWLVAQAQQKAQGYLEYGQQEWVPTRQTIGDLIQQVTKGTELDQQVGYNVPASAFYTALFVLYYILLRKKLWHQRQRTNVYYGDASVELARSTSSVGHDSVDETPQETNGDTHQLKMHVATSRITLNPSKQKKARDGDQASPRSILHSSSAAFQASSPNDYVLLMKLAEACNIYAITVPISILTLAIMEMNGINGYVLHTLYLIFGYCTYLYIHGGLLSDREDFALGKRAAAHEIGLTVLAIAGITCVLVYVGSLL